MRKLNHQFEAQVWYDPEEKKPQDKYKVIGVIEDTNTDLVYISELYIIGDHWFATVSGGALSDHKNLRVLAWTAWSPEYLFEPVDVHAPIRGIVKESNRGGKNVWN